MAEAITKMRLLLLLVLVLLSIQHADSIKSCKLDVVFCIDNSGSIGGFRMGGKFIKNWELVKGFAIELIKEMRISRTRTRVGLVDFGDAAYLQFDLKKYNQKADILKAVTRLDYRGELTNTTGGLKVSRMMLTNKEYGSRGADVPKLIVLITDGDPTVDEQTLDDEIWNLRKAQIPVIAVGVTDKVNASVMHKIATSKEDFFHAESFDDLDTIKRIVVTDEICEIRNISTLPPPTTRTTSPSTTTITTSPTTTTAQPTTTQTTTTTRKPKPHCQHHKSDSSSSSSESKDSSDSSDSNYGSGSSIKRKKCKHSSDYSKEGASAESSSSIEYIARYSFESLESEKGEYEKVENSGSSRYNGRIGYGNKITDRFGAEDISERLDISLNNNEDESIEMVVGQGWNEQASFDPEESEVYDQISNEIVSFSEYGDESNEYTNSKDTSDSSISIEVDRYNEDDGVNNDKDAYDYIDGDNDEDEILQMMMALT